MRTSAKGVGQMRTPADRGRGMKRTSLWTTPNETYRPSGSRGQIWWSQSSLSDAASMWHQEILCIRFNVVWQVYGIIWRQYQNLKFSLIIKFLQHTGKKISLVASKNKIKSREQRCSFGSENHRISLVLISCLVILWTFFDGSQLYSRTTKHATLLLSINRLNLKQTTENWQPKPTKRRIVNANKSVS